MPNLAQRRDTRRTPLCPPFARGEKARTPPTFPPLRRGGRGVRAAAHAIHLKTALGWGWRAVSRRATRSMGVSSWISNLRSSKRRKYQSRSKNIPERDRLRQGVVRPRARWHHHVDSGQRRSRAVKSPGSYPFWRSAMPCRPAKRRYGAISLATVGRRCDMNSMALMAGLQSE